ncbi:MAG: VCBS repeat-containing protein [Nitrospinota bacterium]|nr:MAG: VCBS repeat-containing protein [Nitrospinota bacterium]
MADQRAIGKATPLETPAMLTKIPILIGFLLLGLPVWAFNLVRIATIPRGHINFYQLPVGDLNHNGWQELVFEQSLKPFSTNVWEHWGANSYQPVQVSQEGCSPAAVGDPDQDGRSDLLCQWKGRALLLESRTPTTLPHRVVWEEPVGGFPGIRGYFVDTDQDHQQEMWIVPNTPNMIEIWESWGDNTYEPVALLSHPLMNPTTLAFGDFDGDNQTEIVVGTVEGLLFVWENSGNDAWELVWSHAFPLNQDAGIVAAAHDLDGDGRAEFLVGGRRLDTFEHVVTIFEQTGDNTYAPVWQLQGDGSFVRTSVRVGDVDGDEQEEFAVAIPGAIQLYKATGDNSFSLIGEVPCTDGHAFQLADLNGNGVAELISNAPGGEHLSLYEWATLHPPVLIPAFFPLRYRIRPRLPLPVWLELFNQSEVTQTIDAWVSIYQGIGRGGPQGSPLRQQQLFTQKFLSPQTYFHRWAVLRIPGRPGRYTLQLQIGTFPDQPLDTKWFTIWVTLP